MKQDINELHTTDVNGNPAGGHATSVGMRIQWQNGPLAVDGDRLSPNGCFVETVIAAALGRLQYYQSTKFSCRENALAITKLEEALHWLGHRTANREARGVEGTHSV